VRITSIAVENFRSFRDRQEMRFEPGFNIILGANNAGKTTVLDALSFQSPNDPHRSKVSMPRYGALPPPTSKVEIGLTTVVSELRRQLQESTLLLPVDAATLERARQREMLISEIADLIRNDIEYAVDVTLAGPNSRALKFSGACLSGDVDNFSGNTSLVAASCTFKSGGYPEIEISRIGGGRVHVANYVPAYAKGVFRFGARRRPGFECGFQSSPELDPEANHLPYCINHLGSNDNSGLEQLCNWVNRIFPDVGWIQATPTGSNNLFRLYCLPGKNEDRRDDLSIPASAMGSGIGNVIAILYVVLTSRTPKVIAIDELTAFLHPRAVRELLTILEAEGAMHQYLITAHSADILTSIRPSTITHLSAQTGQTIPKQVGSGEIHQLRGELAELGIRMTDLHSRDRVLWVEGQSEEIVMPGLLRFACPEISAGTAVLRVERTGTFKTKKMDPKEILAIYERLSGSSSLVPPMLCILLDGDTYQPRARTKLEHETRGKLRFLNRAMIENYLLDADAIVAVLREPGELTITKESIESAIAATGIERDLVNLHGGDALAAIFSDTTTARHEFKKTRDVPALVDWLLANKPAFLEPLASFLKRTLSPVAAN
jgi:hypothetical protein